MFTLIFRQELGLKTSHSCSNRCPAVIFSSAMATEPRDIPSITPVTTLMMKRRYMGRLFSRNWQNSVFNLQHQTASKPMRTR